MVSIWQWRCMKVENSIRVFEYNNWVWKLFLVSWVQQLIWLNFLVELVLDTYNKLKLLIAVGLRCPIRRSNTDRIIIEPYNCGWWIRIKLMKWLTKWLGVMFSLFNCLYAYIQTLLCIFLILTSSFELHVGLWGLPSLELIWRGVINLVFTFILLAFCLVLKRVKNLLGH